MSNAPANAKQSGSMQEEEISLLELFHTLWFRRRLLFSTALFIIVIGLIILMQQVPRYTATSSIMVGVPKTQVVDIEAVLAGVAGGDSAINGEVEVIKSRELAKKLIDKLNLLSLEEFNPELRAKGLLSYLSPGQYIPENWKLALGKAPDEELTEEEQNQLLAATATDIFLSKLKVSPIKRSNVIKIKFESLSPKLAARIANELPESYIIGQMEAKFEATEKATKWLDEQLSELREKVAASEKAVEIYREQHGLTEVKEGSGVIMEQLLAINSQLIIARAERAEAEARLRQIKTLMKGKGAGIATASKVLSSVLIQRLREQEARVTRKASELSTEFGAKHPKMLQVKAEKRDIENQIKLETQKIASGLGNEVEVARTRENSLRESLDELKLASGTQQKEYIQLRALVREATANRTLFETFLGRFKETSSTSGMEEADARVISKAEIPMTASYPKKKLMLILIIIGAFFIAVILVFIVQALTPGLHSPEQVEHELGIPAIGLIPYVQDVDPQDYILEKPHSSYSEALNSLKTSLMLSGPDDAVKAIQITSAVPEEGKSALALSFSRMLAMSGKKVILVDADLRRGTLEKKLGISATSKGLTDLVMSDNTHLSDFVIKDEKSGAFIMPKGAAEYVNATDIFSSHRMEAIIVSLKKQFDYIIFDTPPVMAVSDARILGRLVDKTVFVVHWDKTPAKVIKAALKQLDASEVDIAGCVLQQVNLKRYSSYSYGDSGYYYHYGKYGQYYTN